MDHIPGLLDATAENDIQSRKKALTPQLLFSGLPWCVHESLPIDSSPELNCSSLSNKSNPAWKDEFVLSQMPMSKLISRWKNQSKTKKTSLALFILEFRYFFFHLLAKRQFLTNIHLQKNPIQYFPLYGTETRKSCLSSLGGKTIQGLIQKQNVSALELRQ